MLTNSNTLIRAFALSFALSLGAGLAAAAPSGDSSDDGQNTNTRVYRDSADQLNCTSSQKVKHRMVDGKKKYYCANQQGSSLSDEEIFHDASGLAKAGYYADALNMFEEIKDKNNPDVLNMMGYSHRKSGRMELAVAYYRKALSLNPNLVQAREYLGEGYVAAGRVDLALVELSEIKQRCGLSCSQYDALKKVIEAASN